MKILIINGAPRSGKSLFCELCREQLNGWGYEYSTVDFVKEIAAKCGWKGEKTPKNRKFLSDLKDLLTEWNDVPFETVKFYIRNTFLAYENLGVDTDKLVFFIHCREPKEIQKFVDRMGAKALIVRRLEAEEQKQSNHADSNVFNYDYDYVICNNGTKEDLFDESKRFLEKIKTENWNSYLEK